MTKYFKFLVWPVAVAPIIYLVAAWSSLPEKVAMHFNMQGQPDRFGNKNELIAMVCILSAVSVFIFFLLSNIYKIDPKKYAADNKEKLQRMGFAVAVFISALACFIIYSSAKGNIEMGMRYILAGVGLLICFIGNYMHSIKPNYFAGLRLPWTLNNEDNWRKTHLLAGKLWFAGGLIMAILCLLLPDKVSFIVFFIVMTILVMIPVVYSYRLYKKNNESENKSAA
jgi:uncharacterized membrane protein